MKIIIAALSLLFLLLQYQLWFSAGGLISTWHLQHEMTKQTQVNARLKKRNDQLMAEVKELKHGKSALEEHARNDLGMIKRNETFYQIVEGGQHDGQ